MRRTFVLFVVLAAALTGSSCSSPPGPAGQPGATAATVHVIELSLPEGAYAQPQKRRSFVQAVLNRLKALPEVEAVAASTPPQPRAVISEAEEILQQQRPPGERAAATAGWERDAA